MEESHNGWMVPRAASCPRTSCCQSLNKSTKHTTLDFRRADFGLLRDLFVVVQWDKALKGRGIREIQTVVKNHLLQGKE